MAEDGGKPGPRTSPRDDTAGEAEAALSRERAAHGQTEAALKQAEQRLAILQNTFDHMEQGMFLA